ncbi:hypothetical protein [Streptomyces sp. H27-H5]|uniref:hypothetical protein n=1 Tax=Streptomyces sp. H27-H5 TaxID=2996460 RepID=UPI00226E0689|nr:hypothetical protein [Streptomyces sp. H27-H5]MCY0960807.1 hypothetical protein [Streptomyces sp. H27-H5]
MNSVAETELPAELSPYEAHLARVLAGAPPLTAEQQSRIRSLFRPGVARVPLAA